VLVKVRWLLMLLPFALWGTAMAAMKPLLQEAGPLTLAWMRLLPAGLVLLVGARLWRGSSGVDRRDWGWLLLFTLVDATAFQALLARGLVGTGAGLGSVLIDSQPLLVALLARSLFGEAINPVGWLGLLIGLLGILCLGLPAPLLNHWWLMGPEVLDVQAWSHGELWMLAAALAMALGTVISRFACRHSDPVAVTGWHMVLGGLPLLAGSALVSLPLVPAWTPVEWGMMAYAALLGSALAYGLFFWFANQGDLTSFTSLTFLTPVFALLCGVVWLHEQLQPLQWVGAVLALVSVLLINRRSLLWQPVQAELVS
jgi:drug/metabolite transporter (DMT)-like permease